MDLQPSSDPGRFVQLTLHTSQCTVLDAALAEVLKDAKDLSPIVENMLWDLQNTFNDASRRPSAYPVQGRMARSLKVRYRRMKGEANPTRTTGARAARTKRRQEERAARKRNR